MPISRRLFLLSTLLLGTVGCAKFQVPAKLPWTDPDPEFVAADKMEVVWTNAILHKAGQPSTRGFGGRVVFHAEGHEDPVMVDGKLTVYGFANEDPTLGDAPPEKKFVFPQDTLAGHQSASMLGPSYSFWLPWDEVHGLQRRLSLVARFEDASGKVVMSKIAHVTLPGRKGDAAESATTKLPDDPYPVQAASFQQAEDNPAAANTVDVPRSTTIHVTPSFSRKILTPSAPEKEAERTALPTITPAPSVNTEAKAATAPPAMINTARNFQPVSTVRRDPHRAEWPRRLPPTPRTGWNRLPNENEPPAEAADLSQDE